MAFRIIQWSFLLGLAFYSLFIGAAQVSLSDLWQMDGEQLQFWWEIMLQSRIPRLCSILVVGIPQQHGHQRLDHAAHHQ